LPEGDTIFRAARALNNALASTTVLGFETGFARLASANDNAPVTGRVIEKVEARGKWLLIHFSGNLILVTHMLMSGSWHIYRTGERWKRERSQMRVLIRTAQYEAVAFSVPIAEFHTARSLERSAVIPKLGPDLLKSDFDDEEARARIRARGDDEIGNVLLDQKVMAGIGNVFKSEICFVCGVHPFRLVSSLSGREIECLVDSARRLMAANVTDTSGNQIVTYTGFRRTTRRSDPSARVWVYRRKGEECRRCGGVIQMQKQGLGARSSYWCPQCQPLDGSN
jgi:endonuclease-8